MQKNETVRQINAYAMQDGVVLGIFGILSLAAFRGSFAQPFLSTLFSVMLFAAPFVAAALTFRFRNVAAGKTGGFTFASGFLHALFTGLYASLWVSLCVYVYLHYFDHGTVFADYARALDTPESQAYLQQTGLKAELDMISGGRGAQGLADAMQAIGAATYAVVPIYFSVIFGPFISALIGAAARRSGKGGGAEWRQG